MRLLLRLLGLLLVVTVLLIGLAFALPDRAHVERSITIARPQSQIYLLLTSLRRFNDWSPWFRRDPAATYVFSGPDSGVGAKLAWKSARSDVGEGSPRYRSRSSRSNSISACAARPPRALTCRRRTTRRA